MSASIELKAVRSGGKAASSSGASPRIIHCSSPEKNAPGGNRRFPNNRVTNSKYTWYNFIPYNLKEQFSLHINRYFLLIAILQLFPVLTPVHWATTWVPLVVVFGISALKEYLDDRERKRQDRTANEAFYIVIRQGRESIQQAQSIEVGDVIQVKEDEDLPCDIMLLASANDGQCFVQTTNLDGESNLKERRALDATRSLAKDEIITFSGVIECAQPNKSVYDFDARLWLQPSEGLDTPPLDQALSLSGEQLLQAATRLRNTEWVWGVAVYTGNQTKIGMNKGAPQVKRTKADAFVNIISVCLFIFQLLLVVAFGAYGESNRRSSGRDIWYLYFLSDDTLEFLYIPLRFLLLNSTFIPISLKLTLDLCKLYYSRFIQWDNNMYDPEHGGAKANNTGISEDLGQVEYILTDKTGTLTQNNMVFKQCSIGGELYSSSHCKPGGLLGTVVRSGRGLLEADIMRNFALNNSIIPVERKSDRQLVYKGSSPDEVALTNSARDAGVKLVFRERDTVKIQVEVNGQLVEESYTILQELEFTSERKRMSVILRNDATGALRVFSKGADDVIFSKLRADQKEAAVNTLQHLNEFGREGLRTLCFAYKDLDQAEFAVWSDAFQAAKSAIEGRAEKVSASFDLIEKDLILQGASAIEDKLQDKVPETIEVLRRAGIKFWMLTGDKQSTALQIATACNLKSADGRSRVAEITGETAAEVGDCIRQHLRDYVRADIPVEGHEEEFANAAQELTVVVQGATLEIALFHFRADLTKLLLGAHAVICCRVTPAQKRELVRLVKLAGKQTLAIGDGGNDVGMIQEAHVGVGIRGREGFQAARASDYHFAFFKYLQNLVLIHGRYSYVRTSLVAQYSFYKSFMFCCMQIFYGFFSETSGSSMFNSLCITAYNALLFFPIVTFVLMRDVPFKTVLAHPQVYSLAARGWHMNARTTGLWFLRALLQAAACFAITVLTMNGDFVTSEGIPGDWETIGLYAFCGFLWVQTFTVLMELDCLTWINAAFVFGFHLLTLLILLVSNVMLSLDQFNGYGSVTQCFKQPAFWLSNLLILGACVGPLFAWRAYRRNWAPNPIDVLLRIAMEEGHAHAAKAPAETPVSRSESRLALTGTDAGRSEVAVVVATP